MDEFKDISLIKVPISLMKGTIYFLIIEKCSYFLMDSGDMIIIRRRIREGDCNEKGWRKYKSTS